MAYRLFEVRAVVADDQTMMNKSFDRSAMIWQSKDLEAVAPTIRVGASDSEATISLGTITTGYAFCIFSDYPILVRLNGSSATQFTMHTNSVPVVNTGAPVPPQCVFMGNIEVSSIRVSPITGAAQTANVWLAVTGDPTNAYT